VAARKHDPDVAYDEQPYQDFQKFVWHRLPMRKYLCGNDKVHDTLAVIVQEWPVKAIDKSKSGETQEVKALEDLTRSCKRHLQLVYGEEAWETWQATLTPIIWQCLWSVLYWYRSSKDNAAALVRWRAKWRHRN
jgi:hypothetical protein